MTAYDAIGLLPALAAAAGDAGWMTHFDDRVAAWAHGFGETGEAVIRLTLAAVLGGIVGLEREVRGHEAGFRTFMLVAAGAALAMIVSMSFSSASWVNADALPTLGDRFVVSVDPARIAYGVMTGVGFLGAGTIIQRRNRVEGLTTAAGIWSVAALGLAAGFGLYVLSVVATLLLLFTLLLLGWARARLPTLVTARLRVAGPAVPDCVERFEALLKRHGMEVEAVTFDRASPESAEMEARVKYMSRRRFRELRQGLIAGGEYRLLKAQ